MKARILNSVLVSAVLIASGCDSSLPLAPDPADLGAQAKPADVGRRPILFWQELVLTGPPSSVEDVDGVRKVRGLVFKGAASGDIVGEAETLTNADINLTTGGGPAWGSWSITTEGGGWEGDFQGLLTANSPNSSFFEGTYVIKGTGANKGRIIRGSFTDSCDDGCMSGAPGDGDGVELYKAEGVMVGRPGGSE